MSEKQPGPDIARQRLTGLLLALVLLGIGLRLAVVLSTRGLWHDEATLALVLEDTEFLHLARPLGRGQIAPVGYLWIVKISAWLSGGYGEWALRAPALIAGLLALPLFAVLARTHLCPRGALFAMLLFALSRGHGYYSWELKQYSLEVLVTCVLLLAFLPRRGPARALEHPWRTAALLALSPWLSLGSVFLLPWAGLALVAAQRSRPSPWSRLRGPIVLVCLSALLFVRWQIPVRQVHGKFMTNFWAADFVPPVFPLQDFLTWHLVTASQMLAWLGGLPYSELLGACLLVAGIVATLRRGMQESLVLLGPLLTIYLGAWFGLFPIPRGQCVVHARVQIYLIPLVLLILGSGASSLLAGERRIGRLLVLGCLVAGLTAGLYPRLRLDFADELETVFAGFRQGDLLLATPYVARPLEYQRRRGRVPPVVQEGTRDLGFYFPPKDDLRPSGAPPVVGPEVQRVWLPRQGWASFEPGWRYREAQRELERSFQEVPLHGYGSGWQFHRQDLSVFDLPRLESGWRVPPASLVLYQRRH